MESSDGLNFLTYCESHLSLEATCQLFYFSFYHAIARVATGKSTATESSSYNTSLAWADNNLSLVMYLFLSGVSAEMFEIILTCRVLQLCCE